MDERLRNQVRDRASDRCEYCGTRQCDDRLPFQVDHIIAEFHHGITALENLAWSCFDCNVYKGTNLAGVDPSSNRIVPLFNPRNEHWNEHFEWSGPRLTAKSPTGRATIEVLRINLPSRIAHRQLLRLLNDTEQK
jgi:hypothetical protein